MSGPVQQAVLEARGLGKSFAMRRGTLDLLRGRPGAVLHAVSDVDLVVSAGETLGIVGESGCGKSTLARMLVRLHEPDAGTLRFQGQDALALTGQDRRSYHRRVQMVFQDPYGSLNPRMRVGEALAEALSVHRVVPKTEIAARIATLLDMVHLPKDAAQRYPHEFSGGQRQRIGIARALSVEPAVIIADEPVSALDVSVQAQIVNLFMELQERLGLALVFITHDLRLVRHIAHRTAVMYLGRVVEQGPAQAMFAQPVHPYTQALLGAVPLVDVQHRARTSGQGVAALRGELPSPLDPPPGCPFHPRCPMAVERCRVERPVLKPAASGWPVACHLAPV